MQAELPEEDMDVRGGGREADQERVVKDDGYGSDNEVDSRNDATWNGTRPPSGKPPVNRSIAAMQAQDEDSSEAAQPSGNLMDTSAEPRNTGGQIAPVGGIAGETSFLLSSTSKSSSTNRLCDRLFKVAQKALMLRSEEVRLCL